MEIREICEVKGMNGTKEIKKEQSQTVMEEKTVDVVMKEENGKTSKKIIMETVGACKTGISKESADRRGNQYVSSEKELHNASGLYSVSRSTDGKLEIKFDDINLEKKRNALKQELTKLKSSGTSDNSDKVEEIKKKLAAVEKKIRMQKK